MKSFKLLNFDHGLVHPENFSVGPFLIEISEQHCENLVHIPKNESITFGWDKDYNKVIKLNPRRRGKWFETANATINEKEIELSSIFPKSTSKNNIDDLCVFLSFISGRITTFEDDLFIDYWNPEEHTDKVVHYGYFSRNKFDWSNLPLLRDQGIAGQFYYLTVAYQSRDFVAKSIHYNNALNVACDKWYQKNSIKYIDRNLRSKIKYSVQSCLRNHNVDAEIEDDILNRIGNNFSPSATFKLKLFLQAIALYPEHDIPETHGRLKWLNFVRNSMAHTGMLPRDRGISDNILGDLTSGIVELVLRINQYYFSKILLKLDDPYLEFIKKLILTYFYRGELGGRRIFDEKYEDYMERAKKEWVS